MPAELPRLLGEAVISIGFSGAGLRMVNPNPRRVLNHIMMEHNSMRPIRLFENESPRSVCVCVCVQTFVASDGRANHERCLSRPTLSTLASPSTGS